MTRRIGSRLPGRSAGVILALLTCSTSPLLAQTTDDPAAFTLTPRGYVQFELWAFPGWDVVAGQGRVSQDNVQVRRARLGIDGAWRRMTFEFSIDPQDIDGAFVKDAYAQMRFTPQARLRVGQFKVPGSRDYDPSARNMDLIERTPITNTLAVGRDVGVRFDGRLARWSYEVGVFAGDGMNRDDRSGVMVAGRTVVDLPHDLELGASVSRARTTANDSAPANGPAFESTSGYRFADGVYVQGARLRLGADMQWSPGPWRFVAEALRLRDERLEQGLDFEDLPAVIGTGFSATVVRRLRRRQNRSGSLLVNALLRRPLDLALRYDYIALDDAGGASGTDSVRPRATDIRARASHGLTVGSTWAASTWMKVLGNVGVEQFTEQRSAPIAGRSGAYLTLGARLQVEWQ